MIFYFSATGNSAYVAKKIAGYLNDSLFSIPKTNPKDLKDIEGDTIGIIAPVYSWGVSPVVTNFISLWSAEFVDNIVKSGKKIWLVLTCGDDTGLAAKFIIKSLAELNLALSAAWSVQMPNTYVLLPGFDVDSHKLEEEKIENSGKRISHIAECIHSAKWDYDLVKGSMPGLKTRIVFPLFKKWGIDPRRWHWTQECISCGKCANACQFDNIVIKGGHPKWGNNCVSCLACYHICPTHAVHYGNITDHKGQYRTLMK